MAQNIFQLFFRLGEFGPLTEVYCPILNHVHCRVFHARTYLTLVKTEDTRNEITPPSFYHFLFTHLLSGRYLKEILD